MGAKGLRIESVAQRAFEGFRKWLASGATVDRYLADQILFPLALAEGESHFTVDELTPNVLTTAHVIRQFLPIRLTIEGSEGKPGAITIRN